MGRGRGRERKRWGERKKRWRVAEKGVQMGDLAVFMLSCVPDHDQKCSKEVREIIVVINLTLRRVIYRRYANCTEQLSLVR